MLAELTLEVAILHLRLERRLRGPASHLITARLMR